jgi:hypothetical protein
VDDMTLSAIILFGGGMIAILIAYYIIKKNE